MRPCLAKFLSNPPKFTVITTPIIHPLPKMPRLQTDGSFGYKGVSRTAVLYRNKKGNDSMQCKTYFDHSTPTESEWCSVLDGIKYAVKKDEGFIELENDNLGVITCLISEIEPSNPIHAFYFTSIYKQIEHFDYVAIRWIPREMNASHEIFKLA